MGDGDICLNQWGNFVLKRADGRVEVYSGNLVAMNATHYRVRIRDGREVDLLRSDVQKVEWLR